MAYEPKTWECGETITAEDLNRIEEGVADALANGFTVTFEENESSWVCDKTFAEIKANILSGNTTNVVMKQMNGDAYAVTAMAEYYNMGVEAINMSFLLLQSFAAHDITCRAILIEMSPQNITVNDKNFSVSVIS